MTIRLFLALLLVIPAFSPAFSQENGGWKTIENDLYSISIPADWESFPPGEGDGIHPYERDGGPYHLYYIAWVAPEKRTRTEFLNAPSLSIESCYRLDGSSLSMETIEAWKMKAGEPPLARNAVRTELKARPGQKRYMVVKEGRTVSVGGSGWHKDRSFSLIQKEGKLVHYLDLTVGEEYWQKHPEMHQFIAKVLDSFRVKKTK